MTSRAELDPQIAAIFRRGSKTYFNSSLFFPRALRQDVFRLYAFVRSADDFVDAVPQDGDGFRSFRAAYERAWTSGAPAQDLVIDNFIELARRQKFVPEWTSAFLDAMQADLSKSRYGDIGETLAYIYGSAEVIGLYMAAMMNLPHEAWPAARALGRSMQYINFIRDIAEDNHLGRTYLPLKGSGLPDLEPGTAAANPEAFRLFMRAQAERYLAWQAEAEAGFKYIPKRARIPIMTASHLYNWTATVISRDPFVVFRRKVKPSLARIFGVVIVNSLRVLVQRY